MSENLLQSADIDPMPDHVDRVRVPEAVGVHVLAGELPVPLDKLPSPLLGDGKDTHLTRDVVTGHVVAQLQ